MTGDTEGLAFIFKMEIKGYNSSNTLIDTFNVFPYAPTGGDGLIALDQAPSTAFTLNVAPIDVQIPESIQGAAKLTVRYEFTDFYGNITDFKINSLRLRLDVQP